MESIRAATGLQPGDLLPGLQTEVSLRIAPAAPPQSPFIPSIGMRTSSASDPLEYRPARQVTGNLMVEASYVGNAECGGQRLCWKGKLQLVHTSGSESKRGELDITNAADRALLIYRSLTQVIARFPNLQFEQCLIQDFPRINGSSRRCGLIPVVGIPPFLDRSRRYLVRFAAGKSDPALSRGLSGRWLSPGRRNSCWHRYGYVLFDAR